MGLFLISFFFKMFCISSNERVKVRNELVDVAIWNAVVRLMHTRKGHWDGPGGVAAAPAEVNNEKERLNTDAVHEDHNNLLSLLLFSPSEL